MGAGDFMGAWYVGWQCVSIGIAWLSLQRRFIAPPDDPLASMIVVLPPDAFECVEMVFAPADLQAATQKFRAC